MKPLAYKTKEELQKECQDARVLAREQQQKINRLVKLNESLMKR